ncbi:putative colanic acid biosynthesis acetyltransferase [Gordonia jinghuaiqii]|uniref:Putative colanic acid biosynthesis acetyltransferase n=1 Tax=Gordonia jinghuaiqii TaxID=2758710 RepID=A0A7D7RQQ1_9ACTN|nr:putative colanic acid biosynthesis acetyltransferase [Gordonia jinghuaiqii]MCR5980388.1 putative colanic acid biosynthesis acetyltransferase [Gordonia jinghuaiqii]QMT01873.1 putative colanic acid biosynthesis acetyltransferase [Gordonia jinghuaiqii]
MTARTSESTSGRFALRDFRGEGYDKGRGPVTQVAWFIVRSVLMCWWVPARARVAVLRLFGADIGERVLIRHDVRIHWPWKLSVGDDTWIGEQAWILNLEPVRIGANTCISQGVLLCTGSHDRFSVSFAFDNAPITIGESVWIATRATVLRGVRVGDRALVGATALVTHDVDRDAMVIAPTGREVERP